MHEEQGDVVDFTFREVEHQHGVVLIDLGDVGSVDLGIQHLTEEVAHEMLVRRANGVGQPQHAHVGEEGQAHAYHRRPKTKAFDAIVDGVAKQLLVVRHHGDLELLLRHEFTPGLTRHWRVRNDLRELGVAHGGHLGNLHASLEQQAYVEQALQVVPRIGANVRFRTCRVQQLITLLPRTNGVCLDS